MSDEQLPRSGAGRVAEEYPEVWQRYQSLGEACAEAGPIRDEQARLVKLALAVGSGSEGAVHSHVRRARAEGIDREALRHVALMAVPTLGFPAAMAALTWINDILDAES
jgi:alkylhydroperoxidase/carboxymuconolactone decarboxylase family protein YurZ